MIRCGRVIDLGKEVGNAGTLFTLEQEELVLEEEIGCARNRRRIRIVADAILPVTSETGFRGTRRSRQDLWALTAKASAPKTAMARGLLLRLLSFVLLITFQPPGNLWDYPGLIVLAGAVGKKSLGHSILAVECRVNSVYAGKFAM
jgi:hypothetical protein